MSKGFMRLDASWKCPPQEHSPWGKSREYVSTTQPIRRLLVTVCISISKESNTLFGPPGTPVVHKHNTSKTANTHGICRNINICLSRIDISIPEGVWFLFDEEFHVNWDVKKRQKLDYYMGICLAIPLAVNFYLWNHTETVSSSTSYMVWL